MQTTLKIAALALFAATFAFAAGDLVQDGAKTSYSVPMSGKGPTGARLPVRTNDAGYLVTGPRQDTANVVRLTCPSAGTTGYKLPAECYDCEGFGEIVNVCDSLNCSDAGGVPHNIGVPWPRCFTQSADGGADAGPTQDESCWTTSGTGTIACTPRVQ